MPANGLVMDHKPRTRLVLAFTNNMKTETPTPYTREELLDMFSLADELPVVQFWSAVIGDEPPEFISVRRSMLLIVVIQELKPQGLIKVARPELPPNLKIQ